MKAYIYSHEKLIGTSELQITDESMGVVAGKFNPNENYDLVRKLIWKLSNSTWKTHFQFLKQLRLNAQLENGFFLSPIGGLLITDIEGLSKNELEFEAAGNNRHVLEDYFLSRPPKIWMKDPWEAISIEQKLAFEEELDKEIGKAKGNGFFNFLKTKHELKGYKYRAIAKLGTSDDVLFSVSGGIENKFDYVVIHLTWSGKLERKGFPRTEFYETFNQFVNYRLGRDSEV